MHKVLLIEDNAGDARLICEMIAEEPDAPFEVECAERLAQGLERLSAGGIGLVLLDLSLPDSMGLETFAKVYAHSPAVPIIVLTGNDDNNLALAAVKRGAQDYLVKGRLDRELLLRSMLIIAGSDAAIVDASAGTLQSWQQVVPALNQMASTLRVDTVKAPAALTPAAGNAVAGLYMGMKPKYTATMQNVTGYASYQNALHFYLFSADGRVYRAYDQLQVPGGAISRFDFDAAERRDPMNSGRYTLDNGKLVIKMHGSPPETIATAAPRGGKVTINTVTYERQ